MALLLNIDCATNTAFVALSRDEALIAVEECNEQKEHASFIQPAIKSLVDKTGVSLNQLDAIAVTAGPGSYTGLRVGMATAKGLCYALNKPLITLNTLEVMAQGAISLIREKGAINPTDLFCPMIDARRMEVFTALFNYRLEKILQPCAIEVIPNTLDIYGDEQNLIYCFGSGSNKCKEVLKSKNVVFKEITHSAKDMAVLSDKAYANQTFANLAYSEPLYLKEFYSNSKI